MSFVFELPEMGPKWYDLITCPKCQYALMFKDDFKESPLTCPDCGEIFDFVPEKEKEFPGVYIKPMANSLVNIHISSDGGQSILGKDQRRAFINVFMGWRNVEDKKGKEIPLTDSLKLSIFETVAYGLPALIINQSMKLAKAKEEQEKN